MDRSSYCRWRYRLLSVLLLAFLPHFFGNPTRNTAAMADEIMTSYTSMRALDKFGNSVQLRHAREAAKRYGRLVVAARCHEYHDHIVVVSVGNQKMVRSITLPLLFAEEEHHPAALPMVGGVVAMCCTGVKSDADWLIRHMQRYAASVWERYDHHPMGTSALAHSVSRLLSSYQQDDLEEEWQSAIGRQKKKNDRDMLESPLSRPLGVQTLLLSTHNAGKRKDEPKMLLVEPTGRIFKAEKTASFSFTSMGKQSDILNERLLLSTLKDPSDLEQLLIREVLQTLAPSRNEVTELLVETIGPDSGVHTVLLVCKQGQVKSRSPLADTAL